MALPRLVPGQFTLETEYDVAELGDARLDRRLVHLAKMMARQPEVSFPKAAANDADLEATYRFLSNDDVSAEAILAPHVHQTVRRARNGGPVVVAHDTT